MVADSVLDGRSIRGISGETSLCSGLEHGSGADGETSRHPERCVALMASCEQELCIWGTLRGPGDHPRYPCQTRMELTLSASLGVHDIVRLGFR